VSVLFQNAVWAVCILNVEVGSDLKIVVSIDVIVLKSIKASFIKKFKDTLTLRLSLKDKENGSLLLENYKSPVSYSK
jgi:hypothetical protein